MTIVLHSFPLPPLQIDSPAAVELAALGATITEVDYASPASLAKALEGVDVVISTLAGAGFGAQVPLADAAKAAGVQLFLPSSVYLARLPSPIRCSLTR